jgi:hypothetical protein
VRLEVDRTDRLLVGSDAVEHALGVVVGLIAAGSRAWRNLGGILRIALVVREQLAVGGVERGGDDLLLAAQGVENGGGRFAIAVDQ